MIRIGLASLTLALVLHSAVAVAADAVPAGLRACAGEKDDGKRLACFDRELARLAESTPAAAPAPVAIPAPVAAHSPEDEFGRAGGAVALEESKQREGTTPRIESLTATVVEVSTRAHGELVMKLDNGQVWSQTTFDSHFSVDVNDKVTIKAGVLGAYRALLPSGRSTSVTRLR
ncbi:MAG TPA: hypothetical protein VE046_18760 [Steroidobacteraceae bacterium]|nr:hypothetical protein [Steroidobacteraceae bacterium]